MFKWVLCMVSFSAGVRVLTCVRACVRVCVEVDRDVLCFDRYVLTGVS